MPPIDRPPMSPQAQAQMGPPGGAGAPPGFGQAVGNAQEQVGKNQIDLAVTTAEKILMGVPDDTFRTYVTRAMAILKTGAAMAQQKGPQSQPGVGQPPAAGAGAPPPTQPQLPSMPGQMPG
jgi:hypothetical protein